MNSASAVLENVISIRRRKKKRLDIGSWWYIAKKRGGAHHWQEEEEAWEQENAAQLEWELAKSCQILEENDMNNQERKNLHNLENECRVLSIDFNVYIFCKIYLDKKWIHVSQFESYRSSTIDKAGKDVEILDTKLDEKVHSNSFDYESCLIIIKFNASKLSHRSKNSAWFYIWSQDDSGPLSQ